MGMTSYNLGLAVNALIYTKLHAALMIMDYMLTNISNLNSLTHIVSELSCVHPDKNQEYNFESWKISGNTSIYRKIQYRFKKSKVGSKVL